MLTTVSIVLGVVSLFLSGVLAMVVAFAAVMIAFLASRRQERYFIYGMLLGALVLIFGNLQNLNILQSGTKNQVENVYQSLKLSNQVLALMKNGDQAQAISAIGHSIKIARQVDSDMLESLLPGFRQHFANEYIEGFSLLQQGISESSPGIKMKGAKLIDLWAKWHAKHIGELEKLRQHQPSLAKFVLAKIN